jgi:nitronate monooxygenase
MPGMIARLQEHQAAEWKLQVAAPPKGSNHQLRFDPSRLMRVFPTLKRPLFFPIVSSASLASLLIKKCAGGVDGLIVEHHSAGGHNAPPRGKSDLSPSGEPVYTERDAFDLEAIAAFGLPFWLAGSYGSPEQLEAAQAAGAQGVQVGTLFSFCRDSGLRDDLRRQVIAACLAGAPPPVFTSPVASPTGFPFKLPRIPGTLSDDAIYAERQRVCDLGYLREAYAREDGRIGWRCASEPVAHYQAKQGSADDCCGRQCLCNALMANIGLGQRLDDGTEELPLLTCGDQLTGIAAIIGDGEADYSAAQVVAYLLAKRPAVAPAAAS